VSAIFASTSGVNALLGNYPSAACFAIGLMAASFIMYFNARGAAVDMLRYSPASNCWTKIVWTRTVPSSGPRLKEKDGSGQPSLPGDVCGYARSRHVAVR